MGAADLLIRLRAAGLSIAVTDAGLRVAPRAALTDDLRQTIRDHRAELVAALQAEPLPARSGNPHLSADDWERCHAGGWSAGEIATFENRRDRLIRWGRSLADAEALAELLTFRDRDLQTRRLCFECARLSQSGRCDAARRGWVVGASRQLEPVRDVLHRCEFFEHLDDCK